MSRQAAEIDLVTYEPAVIGTRVRDADGIEWVRARGYGGAAPWMRVTPVLDDTRDTWSVWSAITPPVLRLPAAQITGGEPCS